MLQHRNQIGYLWLGLLLLTALLTTAWPAAVAAQGSSASLRIDPLQARGDPDQDLSVQVVIEDVENLGFFQFDLTFDPAVVQVKDVTLGEYLGSTGRDTTEVGPRIDNDQGLLTFGAFSVGNQAGPGGNGVLAVLTLTGVAEGVSPLDLSNIRVLTTSNTVIATFVSSRATVTIGEIATPTPTATATVGAGTPVPTLPGSALPAPGTTVPSPTAAAGTTPASQATATAPVAATATTGPGTGTPTPGPATATSAAAATPVGTAEPAVTVTASAAAATPQPAAEATEVAATMSTLPAGATETLATETAPAVTTPSLSEPGSTPAATEVALARPPANVSGERATTSAEEPIWLLGIGVGALAVAGIIAGVIVVLVHARRKST